jgi:hypothetical protein
MMTRCLVLLFAVFLPFGNSIASAVQDQAEFLAGIPLSKTSPLAPLQQRTGYLEHQRELQDQWAFCKRIRYEAMQAWGREHLSHDSSTRGVLRYLFGGPDFLNAHAFFPDARIMVLGGLEPVGEMPPPEALTPETVDAGLKALRESLHTSLFCGYFITSEMKPQLLDGSFRGVLPVLMTELVLTGNQILSIEPVKPFGSPGVKILYARFDPRADTQPQTLYYFQADLSNGTECTHFLNWLGGLGEGASYLKAASYLLPRDSFSQTREFLLKTSTLILQDDSGIPFAAFQPDLWKIQLFGAYTDPLPIFNLHREPALDAAYASSDYAGSIPFGVGYHVNASDANLLLAIRRNVTSNEAVAYPSVITPMSEATPTPAPTPKPKPKRTPKPTPIPIRKALPVDGSDSLEIRRAIPVETPPIMQPQISRPLLQSQKPTPLPEPSSLQNL